jgi:hypothetical protein
MRYGLAVYCRILRICGLRTVIFVEGPWPVFVGRILPSVCVYAIS